MSWGERGDLIVKRKSWKEMRGKMLGVEDLKVE